VIGSALRGMRVATEKRTRAALASRKERGTKLGNPTNAGDAAAAGAPGAVTSAEQFAEAVLPIIARLQEVGIRSYRGIAVALNGRGVRTARGGRWQVSNVRNLLARVGTGF
jgi:hypothetical protein